MGIIVPPTTDTQYEHRANHPDKPPHVEDEGFVEYLTRAGDWASTTPPTAPAGFELIECLNEPRHFPIYVPIDDDLYPGHCLQCQIAEMSDAAARRECEKKHRRWKSWKVWGILQRHAYSWGVICSGGVSYGRCEHCGIGVQYIAPLWRGRRPYVLGRQTDWWACLLKRRHIYSPMGGRGNLCTKCCPCPCGSTDQDHVTGYGDCSAGAY